MSKRFFSITLAALMAASVTGCGNSAVSSSSSAPASSAASSAGSAASSEAPKADGGFDEKGINPTGYPAVKEKVTLTGFGNQNVTHKEWNELYCFDEAEKVTNIHVEWTTAPAASFTEKKNILMASGSYPDIFYRCAFTASEQINYGSTGVLAPLGELLEKYAPNFIERVKEYPSILKDIRMPDGKVYALPTARDPKVPECQQNFLNRTWLNKLGLKVPDTTDEITEVFKAFRDGDPNGNGKKDEVVYSDRVKGASLWLSTYGAFGMGNLGVSAFNQFVDTDESGKVRCLATTENYKKQLEWIKNLYGEKVLDPELFTQDQNGLAAKGDQDLVGAFFHNNSPEIVGAKAQKDFQTIRAPQGPDGQRQYNNIGALNGAGAFAVSAASKYQAEAVRWVDWFYSYEGDLKLRLGEEGTTYTVNPDGGYKQTEYVTNNKDGLNSPQAIGQYAIGYAGGGCPEFVFEDIELARWPAATSEGMKVLLPDMQNVTPVMFNFTNEEQDKLNSFSTDIKNYVEESRVSFVTGKMPMSQWDTYVTTLDRMGLKDYVAIYQAAYDRYTAE